MIESRDRLLARALGQLGQRAVLFDDLGAALGGGAAEDDEVDERVGAEPVGAMHRGAGRLAHGEEAGHDGIGIAVARADDLAMQIGGDAAHIVVRRRQHGDRRAGQIDAGEDARQIR